MHALNELRQFIDEEAIAGHIDWRTARIIQRMLDEADDPLGSVNLITLEQYNALAEECYKHKPEGGTY